MKKNEENQLHISSTNNSNKPKTNAYQFQKNQVQKLN